MNTLPNEQISTPNRASRPQHPRLNENCLVCGQANPNGLQLNFSSIDEEANAEWIPTLGWESFRGVIHGGIISAVLDEAMSQAIIFQHKNAFTADLHVRFHEKVEVGELLTVRGRVLGSKKRLLFAEAELLTCDGARKASATATFLMPRN